MSPRVLIILGLAMMAVTMVNANCCCCEGKDVCTCADTVVRPPQPYCPCPSSKSVYACISPPSYTPVEPPCGCRFSDVRPAPKPACCMSCFPRPCGCKQVPVETIPFTRDDFDVGYPHDHDEEPETGVNCGKKLSAADALSLHLAYTAGLQRPAQYVREAALAYGFSKTPEYQPIERKNEEINEEALNVVQKKILELRSPTHPQPVFTEEEYPLDDDADFDNKGSATVSYSELGYLPEKGRPCYIGEIPKPCKAPEPVVYVGHQLPSPCGPSGSYSPCGPSPCHYHVPACSDPSPCGDVCGSCGGCGCPKCS